MALDAAVKLIQDKLGVTDGGTAGDCFSDSVVQNRLVDYIKLEKELLSQAKLPKSPVTAWVIYDNDGESPFAVFKDKNDPDLLELLKDNPEAQVVGVTFPKKGVA